MSLKTKYKGVEFRRHVDGFEWECYHLKHQLVFGHVHKYGEGKWGFQAIVDATIGGELCCIIGEFIKQLEKKTNEKET